MLHQSGNSTGAFRLLPLHIFLQQSAQCCLPCLASWISSYEKQQKDKPMPHVGCNTHSRSPKYLLLPSTLIQPQLAVFCPNGPDPSFFTFLWTGILSSTNSHPLQQQGRAPIITEWGATMWEGCILRQLDRKKTPPLKHLVIIKIYFNYLWKGFKGLMWNKNWQRSVSF